MFVIMAVATDTRAVGEAAAIAIGPAIAASDYTAIWVYIAAPLAGATLAALAYQFLRANTKQAPQAAGSDASHDQLRDGVPLAETSP